MFVITFHLLSCVPSALILVRQSDRMIPRPPTPSSVLGAVLHYFVDLVDRTFDGTVRHRPADWCGAGFRSTGPVGSTVGIDPCRTAAARPVVDVEHNTMRHRLHNASTISPAVR